MATEKITTNLGVMRHGSAWYTVELDTGASLRNSQVGTPFRSKAAAIQYAFYRQVATYDALPTTPTLCACIPIADEQLTA